MKKRNEQAYESFRNHLQSHIPTKLPERLGRARFLLFDHSWHPHFVEEANRPSQLIRQLFSRAGDISRDHLRPVLKALNLELPTQRNHLLDNLVTVLLWLGAIFSVGFVLLSFLVAAIRIITMIQVSLV